MVDTAVFEFFLPTRPSARNVMIAAGLERAVEFLKGLHVETTELEWLVAQPSFDSTCIVSLAELHSANARKANPPTWPGHMQVYRQYGMGG